MAWKERTMENAVGLGDDQQKGQKVKVGGLLKEVRETDTGKIYVLIQKSGEELSVWGSTAMDNQIRYDADIGKFIKAEFIGWGTSKRGMKFKQIVVSIWDGEPTPEMQKWPQYDEIQRRIRAHDKQDKDQPPPLEDGDYTGEPEEEDDLPFS